MPRWARRWLQSTKNRASATSAASKLSKWTTSHSSHCTVPITDSILPPPCGLCALHSKVVDELSVEKHVAAGHVTPGGERSTAVGVEPFGLAMQADGIAERADHDLARRPVRRRVTDDESREVILDHQQPV